MSLVGFFRFLARRGQVAAGHTHAAILLHALAATDATEPTQSSEKLVQHAYLGCHLAATFTRTENAAVLTVGSGM